MARYLILWKSNPVAPWPTDPAKYQELNEKMWAAIDALMKKGEIKDFGWFLESRSGYGIGEGEGTDVFRDINMFSPYIEVEVHEIVPHEKAKDILRALWKIQAATKK